MKDQISQMMIELLEMYPYKDISVSVICKSVPISRQTFYRYFNSKDDIIKWIVEQDFMKNAFPIFRFHLKERGASVFFSYLKEHALFYQRIFEYDNGMFLEQCFKNAYNVAANNSDVFSKPVKKNKNIINPNVYRLYSINGIVSVVLYWIQDHMKIPEDDIARDLYLMMEEPLGYVRDYYFVSDINDEKLYY